MLAVIDAPGDTWVGQRDSLMLEMMFNTGARVSEIFNRDVMSKLIRAIDGLRRPDGVGLARLCAAMVMAFGLLACILTLPTLR